MENQSTDAQVDGNPITTVYNVSSESLIKMMFLAIGEDPDREGLLDTPRRVVKSWGEIFGGYKINPASVLGTTFETNGYDQMVICKDIEMYSTCEHHMIPFYGSVDIGYVPRD